MHIAPMFLPDSVSFLFITFVRIHFTYSRINFHLKISVTESSNNLMAQSILTISENEMKATNNKFII